MNKNRIFLLLALTICGSFKMVSQVSIDNPNPHPNAILDLDNPDSDKEALMLPRAKIERMRNLIIPELLPNGEFVDGGLMFFDKTTAKVYCYDGITWQELNPIVNRRTISTNLQGTPQGFSTIEGEYDLEGNLKVSQNLEASRLETFNLEVDNNAVAKNLEVTDNLKFTESGAATGKEGFVAVNENGGNVTWKDPSSLAVVSNLQSELTNNKTEIDNEITTIQENQNRLLTSANTPDFWASKESTELLGFDDKGPNGEGVPTFNGSISLPNDGVARQIQVISKAVWNRKTRTGNNIRGMHRLWGQIDDVTELRDVSLTEQDTNDNYDDTTFCMTMFLHNGDGGRVFHTFWVDGDQYDIKHIKIHVTSRKL